MDDSARFIASLEEGSLAGLRAVPKSDLHNHVGRGGSIRALSRRWGVEMLPPEVPFSSLAQMQDWFDRTVKVHRPGIAGYLERVEAAFDQAREDSVALLSLSFGWDEVGALGGMEALIHTIGALHRSHAPDADFRPELMLGRASDPEAMFDEVAEALSHGWFQSIDIYADNAPKPIGRFRRIYDFAAARGMKRRAHAGEFGSAEDVRAACEALGLDEVHHGIAAASSPEVMRYLADRRIRLNVCPTSNVMLGRARSYADHPIKALYEHGIPVTINTDDLLIFNQSASEEYLNLFRAGLLDARALNAIRLTGLSA